MNSRVLLVEDDPSLGFVIRDNLSLRGYEVVLCEDGNTARTAIELTSFDLCILDVMLPGVDGFTLAREIRASNHRVPILFLTARSMTEDRIQGFRSGGDDYIVKPFSIEELCLRMEVFLRRTGSSGGSFRLGLFSFDPVTYTLSVGTDVRTLTEKESQVLMLLCHNQDRVIKREEILKRVWGEDDYFMGRSLDVFISRLRKYLKADPSLNIVNYHGVGFRLEVK